MKFREIKKKKQTNKKHLYNLQDWNITVRLLCVMFKEMPNSTLSETEEKKDNEALIFISWASFSQLSFNIIKVKEGHLTTFIFIVIKKFIDQCSQWISLSEKITGLHPAKSSGVP